MPEKEYHPPVIKKRTQAKVNPAYFAAKKELESKAVAGKCIVCRTKLPPWRKKYCTKKCFDDWFLQFNPPFRWRQVRYQAMKRDHWRCVKCGMSRKELNIKYYGTQYEKRPKIIVDHIEPVSLGGAEFDLANLQTLCLDCNRVKTKDDIKDIVKLRKKITLERLYPGIGYPGEKEKF